MATKNYLLSDTDYNVIMSALAQYATIHFDKSKTLKRETDAQYHKELFQKAMNAQFELREQKGQH